VTRCLYLRRPLNTARSPAQARVAGLEQLLPRIGAWLLVQVAEPVVSAVNGEQSLGRREATVDMVSADEQVYAKEIS
jgi:hypothetical protein